MRCRICRRSRSSAKRRTDSRAAELYADRYEGDWQALLTALFSGDIQKAAHNVKDLMAALLAQGLPDRGLRVRHGAARRTCSTRRRGAMTCSGCLLQYSNEELPRPVHLEPDAFSMLGRPRGGRGGAAELYGGGRGAPRDARAEAARAGAASRSTTTSELPLCAVLARMEQRRLPRRPCGARASSARRSPTAIAQPVSSRSTAAAGADLQHQLPQAARGGPLRKACDLPARQKDQDRLVHKRGRARKAALACPIVADVLAIPAVRQAEEPPMPTAF